VRGWRRLGAGEHAASAAADCAERARLEGFTLEDATDLTSSGRRLTAEPLSLSFMPLADTPSGLFRLHKRVRRACGSFSDVARIIAREFGANKR
jgi:hypothetical protein